MVILRHKWSIENCTFFKKNTSNSDLKSALFCLSAVTRSLVSVVDGESIVDEGAILEFDWKSMMAAQRDNDRLCSLVYELKLPFSCGKVEL